MIQNVVSATCPQSTSTHRNTIIVITNEANIVAVNELFIALFNVEYLNEFCKGEEKKERV